MDPVEYVLVVLIVVFATLLAFIEGLYLILTHKVEISEFFSRRWVHDTKKTKKKRRTQEPDWSVFETPDFDVIDISGPRVP